MPQHGLLLPGPLLATGFLHSVIDLLPQVLAVERSVSSVSHSHMDHTVMYPLALCHNNLLEVLRSPVFHVLWP